MSSGDVRRVGRPAIALAAACLALVFAASASAYVVRGSMAQVYVTGATPGKKLTLVDKHGDPLHTKAAGPLGGVVYRKVEPGGGYRVVSGSEESRRVKVMTTKGKPPDPSIYDQSIAADGYQYLTTRDGTQLAINVHPPLVPVPGPVPTLIEYSGYAYAKPGGGESSIAQIAEALGFAVVDVNMRGTGCSGGAFDYFEPAQGLDGYDVIETIARQPWVLHNKVGMMGISYGGISQLFTARTRPPSLAAIAPLSLIDQTQTTLYPGGVLNTGFALNWAEERVDDSRAAGPDQGQSWAYEQIQNGDTICKDNQVLHPEAVNLLDKVKRNSTYKPKVADPLAPLTFVHKIKVPTFIACQWTDEQTGGHCPTMAAAFTGTDRKWFTFTNGTHVDSLDPETFNRWYDFLELYVAQRKPSPDPVQIVGAPVVYQAAMGINGVTLPPDPIQLEPTYESALAAFENLPPIRILFDSGAGGQPGFPYPGFEQSFSRWPVPGTKAKSFYLGDQGSMTSKPPKTGAADSFTWNQDARPPTDFTGNTASGTNGLWTQTPPYNWTQNPAGTAASYVTAPLKSNTTVIGAGSLRAWVRSSEPDVDLQITVSEVRPDGKETFVQGGWLKAQARKLDPEKSTKLAPVLSLRKGDLAPMPKGEFAKLTIPLYYQGHAYRAGSRIRVTISAVDGDQPIWAFAEAVGDGARIEVAHSPEMPSKLQLPVVGSVNVPTGLPPCPALRGEPCRDYVAYTNKSTPLP